MPMSFGHCHEKCPYSEFVWSVFSRIRTEYGDWQSKSPYSVQMVENTAQKNSEYGHFLLNVCLVKITRITENIHITNKIFCGKILLKRRGMCIKFRFMLMQIKYRIK